VELKATENCMANALRIAIAKAENYPDYKAYRQDRKIRPVVNICPPYPVSTFLEVGNPRTNPIPRTFSGV